MMSPTPAERPASNNNAAHNPRLLFSLLALVGVATCFVFGEWQILSPFERFLSSTRMEKAVLQYMPSTLMEKSMLDSDAYSSPIKRIVLLGERHSGTTYTTRKLQECFPHLQVTDEFLRYKHWFQPTPEYVKNVTSTIFPKDLSKVDETMDLPLDWPSLAKMQDPSNAFQDTLVVVMFRNAYDWLDAMRQGPHHWPNHLELYKFPNGPVADVNGNGQLHEFGVDLLTWQDFVKANMTLDKNIGNALQICQNGYRYGSVSPCVRSKELYPDVVKREYKNISEAPNQLNYNANRPIYEYDPSTNKPFKNPLDFRAAKIQNFLSIPKNWNVGGFLTIQQEQVNQQGFQVVLDKIVPQVGNAVCMAEPPKNQQAHPLDKEWQEWITSNTDWDVEARIGYTPREVKEDKPVEQQTVAAVPQLRASKIEPASRFDRIVLLGERHSGTTYTTKMLERCFPDIDVSNFLSRFKHWFQPTPEYVASTTKEYLPNDITEEEGEDMFEIHNQWPNIAAMDEPKTAFQRTLLIVMFRNPYDWLEAMRAGPHHWTNHFKLYRFPRAPVPDTTGNPWYGSNFSSWADFVNAEMTWSGDDGSEGTQLCQNGFMKGFVTPCLKSKEIYPPEVKKDYPNDISEAPDSLPFNAHHPIYELDPETGEPYANPLDFRTAKIKNFLDIPNHWDVGSFMTLQHEQVNNEGSGFLLKKVGELLGMDPICEPDPPKHQPERVINPGYAKWITENADWETEGKIGYEPRPSTVKKEEEEEAKGKALSAATIKDDEDEGEDKEESTKIERIVLLGERHSGTSYTTQMLAKCFPKLNVDDFFGRYKHWFQPTPEFMVNVTSTFLKNPEEHAEVEDMYKIAIEWPKLTAVQNVKEDAFKNTLLIVMFRNAYDWLEAMREGPHHWPSHFEIVDLDGVGNYGLKIYDWRKFVEAPMDFDFRDNEDKSDSSVLCQNGFPFGSVSPCLKSKELYPDVVKKDYEGNLDEMPERSVFNAHNPIYEMDANGKPFAHPLALRSAKIKDFLDIPNKWNLGGFMKLQHEQVNMKGSAFVLEQVEKLVGMKAECEPDPPKKQEGKELESDWSDWITKNADWDVENEVGYEPRVKTTERSKKNL